MTQNLLTKRIDHEIPAASLISNSLEFRSAWDLLKVKTYSSIMVSTKHYVLLSLLGNKVAVPIRRALPVPWRGRESPTKALLLLY